MGIFQPSVFQASVFDVTGHVFACAIFQHGVFQSVCGVTPPTAKKNDGHWQWPRRNQLRFRLDVPRYVNIEAVEVNDVAAAASHVMHDDDDDEIIRAIGFMVAHSPQRGN